MVSICFGSVTKAATPYINIILLLTSFVIILFVSTYVIIRNIIDFYTSL